MTKKIGCDIHEYSLDWCYQFWISSCSVKMFTATEDKDIHFRSLHKECGMPVSYAKTCRHCEKEMKTDEIVKGYVSAENRVLDWMSLFHVAFRIVIPPPDSIK